MLTSFFLFWQASSTSFYLDNCFARFSHTKMGGQASNQPMVLRIVALLHSRRGARVNNHGCEIPLDMNVCRWEPQVASLDNNYFM